MSNSYFTFKRFTVWHDQCAMKVGTDGVLLGAWVHPNDAGRLLDVGTGTGLIALMLAQRSEARIDAIDLDADACRQARANVEDSPFAGQVTVHHTPLAAYVPVGGGYDLIVSNPPYFSHSLKCPDQQRSMARHTDSLQLSSLLRDCCRLLASSGRIALVLPFDQEEELLLRVVENKLYVTRKTIVYPTPVSPPKRLLVELSNTSLPAEETSRLVLEESRHQYTVEYRALTDAYYLDR